MGSGQCPACVGLDTRAWAKFVVWIYPNNYFCDPMSKTVISDFPILLDDYNVEVETIVPYHEGIIGLQLLEG